MMQNGQQFSNQKEQQQQVYSVSSDGVIVQILKKFSETCQNYKNCINQQNRQEFDQTQKDS